MSRTCLAVSEPSVSNLNRKLSSFQVTFTTGLPSCWSSEAVLPKEMAFHLSATVSLPFLTSNSPGQVSASARVSVSEAHLGSISISGS